MERLEDEGASAEVVPTPRLRSDVLYLEKFTSGAEPAKQMCWAEGSVVALYLIGNASGNGLGNGV